MLALMEERQKLEEDVLSKDNSFSDRRQSGSNRELDRVKSDLKMTQEYLRIATDTNTELQVCDAVDAGVGYHQTGVCK